MIGGIIALIWLLLLLGTVLLFSIFAIGIVIHSTVYVSKVLYSVTKKSDLPDIQHLRIWTVRLLIVTLLYLNLATQFNYGWRLFGYNSATDPELIQHLRIEKDGDLVFVRGARFPYYFSHDYFYEIHGNTVVIGVSVSSFILVLVLPFFRSNGGGFDIEIRISDEIEYIEIRGSGNSRIFPINDLPYMTSFG